MESLVVGMLSNLGVLTDRLALVSPRTGKRKRIAVDRRSMATHRLKVNQLVVVESLLTDTKPEHETKGVAFYSCRPLVETDLVCDDPRQLLDGSSGQIPFLPHGTIEFSLKASAMVESIDLEKQELRFKPRVSIGALASDIHGDQGYDMGWFHDRAQPVIGPWSKSVTVPFDYVENLYNRQEGVAYLRSYGTDSNLPRLGLIADAWYANCLLNLTEEQFATLSPFIKSN